MEFKNTIAALHFNAEEIRELVAGLENSDRISRIDIDLILDKIRSMYDLVLDIQSEINEKKINSEQPEPSIIDEKQKQIIKEVKSELIHDEHETFKNKRSSDIIFEEGTMLLKEKIFFKSPPNEKTDEEKLQERKQVAKENIEKDLKKEKEKTDSQDSKQSYISDRFKTTKPTLYDELANKTIQEDLSQQLKSQGPIGIASTLGLNEKFEMINELFGGNREKFESTMQVLGKAGSFVEAYNYLKENFNWDMDSQYVQRLLEIIRQKLIIRRNDQ
jgi:hypothetical protein